jgi:ParB/RepB/Spo0J family partition protein
MSDLKTPLLDVEKLEVIDGFNPRTHMDPDALERLAGSLGKADIVQPLTVRPLGGGKYAVIAGHRRLEAAKLAGIEKVPVHVRKNGGSPRAAALAENLHREDLDPIDIARGLQELAGELNLTTHKKIAAELDVSGSWVSQHLRLLRLPEAVQSYVARGEVPVEAERVLRSVADVSPRVAECVCELATRKKIKGREFVTNFDELLLAAAEARFEDPPTMINPASAQLSKVVRDPERLRDLGERHLAARPYTHTDDPVLKFNEAEVDAARAAGCLVEHEVDQGGWSSTIAFITDAEFAADLAVRAVERIESEAAARRKEEKEWRASSRGRDSSLTPKEEKEARKAERQERKEIAAEARRQNEVLGLSLLKRRGGASRKEHALARAKALAAIVLADNPKLAARGLRLVATQLQEIEVKQLKTSGESREKVSYADAEQCAEYLAKRIEDARSANEVLELLGDAVIASLLADERELPQSKRIGGVILVPAEVEALLAADVKSVRPRRRCRQAQR